MIGTVRVVRDDRRGGELTADAAVGAASLTVDDAGDFSEEGGQVVTPTGGILDYTATDYDTDTLTLAILLIDPLVTGDWLAPWSATHEDTERIAEVEVGDGPPVIAVVPHQLRMLLAPGTRAPETEEQVELWEPVPGRMEVRSILGKEPIIVGASIYVPDTENPNFTVDEEGRSVAKSLRVEPEDATTVALSIVDVPGTSAPWFQALSSALVIRLEMLGDGWRAYGTAGKGNGTSFGLYASSVLRGYNQDSDTQPKLTLEWAGGNPGIAWGVGGSTAPDVALIRVGTSQVSLTDNGAGTADLLITGELFLGTFSDVRLRRPAARVLEIDDGGGDGVVLDLVTRGAGPLPPSPGRLRLYVLNDGGFPQLKVKNSDNTVQDLTTFTDGA